MDPHKLDRNFPAGTDKITQMKLDPNIIPVAILNSCKYRDYKWGFSCVNVC